VTSSIEPPSTPWRHFSPDPPPSIRHAECPEIANGIDAVNFLQIRRYPRPQRIPMDIGAIEL